MPLTTQPRRRRMWMVLVNVVLICLLAALVILMLAESRELHRRHAVEAVESLALSVAYKVAAEISAVDPALRPLRSTDERGNSAELADATDRLRVAGPRERDDGHWVIELARMPRAAAGGEAPAVVAEIDVARFERLFADLGLGQRSTVSLCMLDLSPVARYSHPPQARNAPGGCSMARKRVDELGRSAEAGSYVARSPLDDIERASAYRRVPGVPMLVLVGLATDDDLAGWNREAASAAALALLAIGVVIGVSVFADRAQRRDDDRRRLLDAECARLRGLLVAISDGLHVVDRDGCLVEFSDAFAAMLGSTREALADAQVMDWERHYPAAHVDHVLRTFAVGQRIAFGSVFERADGSRIDVAITAASAHIDERDLLILSARDVTGARQALQRLRASEALLERTGRIAGVGGWELAAGSGRLELTSEARRLLCLAPEARVGQRDCLRRLGRDQRRILLRAIRESWQSGRSLDLELQARGPDERPRWLHCTGERSAGPDGATRLAGAIRDVTERHERTVKLQHEQALRQTLEQQAAAQTQMLRERGEMLDVLAHEVRQPLNNASAAMQSALASLHEMGEQAAAPRLARAQAVLGQVMARLDNTLAVATLLARQGPAQREDTDLDTLLAVTIADMPAAERGRIEVERDSAARTVSIDMSLMRLALRNLLSNALKYSLPGSKVTIRIADSDQPLGLVIDVNDRGCGIEPGLREHLFERGSRGRQTPGAEHGLGLYIVRRVMELHGGAAHLLRSGDGGTTMRLLVAEEPDD